MVYSTVKGIGFTMFIWCCLLAWVARCAQSRGRSALVWGLIAGGAGGLGLVAGSMVAGRLIWDAEEVNLMITMIGLFLPFVMLIVPMVIVAYVVLREPIKVAGKGPWPVTFMKQGPGSIIEVDGRFAIEVGGTRRELPADARVEADGECVRITLPQRGAEGREEDLIAMPMGKPATPAGRKHQSLVLAKRLRAQATLR